MLGAFDLQPSNSRSILFNSVENSPRMPLTGGNKIELGDRLNDGFLPAESGDMK